MSFYRYFYNGDRSVQEQRRTEVIQRVVTIALAAAVVVIWFLALRPITAALPLLPAYASLLWDIGRIGVRVRRADSPQRLGCGVADGVLTAGSILLMALTIVANNVIRADDVDEPNVHPGNILPAVPLTISLTLIHLTMAITAFLNRRAERRTVPGKDVAPSIEMTPNASA